MSEPVRNIKYPRLGALDWSESARQQSMEHVIDYVCARADEAVGWYLSKKDEKRVWAQRLRMGAIVFAVAGGALPALSEALGSAPGGAAVLSASWGYVIAAVAGAFIAVDRFFGFSSAWMRFLQTQMTIQDSQSEFLWKLQSHRVSWGGQPPTEAQVGEILELCNEFAAKVRATLRQEMEAWRQEFQAALKDVEDVAKAQRESLETQVRAARPGALTVTVTNGDAADAPWTLAVDGETKDTCAGKRAAITGVPPGLRRVVVSGMLDGSDAQDSAVVEVAGGAVSTVELTLS